MKKNEVDSALMSLQDVIQTTKSKLLNGSESLEVQSKMSSLFIFLIPFLILLTDRRRVFICVVAQRIYRKSSQCLVIVYLNIEAFFVGFQWKFSTIG